MYIREDKTRRGGFTLAELLIVVAIIAVLVAIAIPVFTKQLERSREATDLSNFRAAYAELVSDYLSEGATQEASAEVSTIKQQTKGWLIDDAKLHARVNGSEYETALPDVAAGETVTMTISADGKSIRFAALPSLLTDSMRESAISVGSLSNEGRPGYSVPGHYVAYGEGEVKDKVFLLSGQYWMYDGSSWRCWENGKWELKDPASH